PVGPAGRHPAADDPIQELALVGRRARRQPRQPLIARAPHAGADRCRDVRERIGNVDERQRLGRERFRGIAGQPSDPQHSRVRGGERPTPRKSDPPRGLLAGGRSKKTRAPPPPLPAAPPPPRAAARPPQTPPKGRTPLS